jgi:hypothetical protein
VLAEALNEFKTKRLMEVKRCIVGEWSEALSDNDQQVLSEAMMDYSISNRQLLMILRNAGASFSLEAIRRHRNEECPCRV